MNVYLIYNCNEQLEIVLMNKLDGKIYNIPKVF